MVIEFKTKTRVLELILRSTPLLTKSEHDKKNQYEFARVIQLG